jgi:hypothetical protein
MLEMLLPRSEKWTKSCWGNDLGGYITYQIGRFPAGCVYRWREGNRAVMLWPEDRIGEVMEIHG